MTANWPVIALASASAACELVTVGAAWRELDRMRTYAERVGRKEHGLAEVFATDRWTGVNPLELDRLRRVMLETWHPSRWSIMVVKTIAPIGILLGLAAAIIAAT